MRRILDLSLMLCIFSFGQDVQEIISKIESNQAKIVDLEADVEVETSIQGRAESLVQTMKIWQAKDENGNAITRTEFEIPEARGQKQEKVIMIMTNDSAITKKGKTVSRLPLTAQANIEARFEGILKSAKSIKILKQEGNVAVLEVVPRETEGVNPIRNNISNGAGLFDKAEITVDIERGVIISQKLFTPMGVIKTETEYGSIGEGEKKIWVLKEMRTITQYGITTMRYKNVEVNKGIDKRKFEL
ncbi:MAG: hypothetical protein ABIL02_06240 [candidate division WOR-3 bacterium]